MDDAGLVANITAGLGDGIVYTQAHMLATIAGFYTARPPPAPPPSRHRRRLNQAAAW